jgi:hypothetical protein
MPKIRIDLSGRPLLDIASYARRGPGRRDHLSPAEIEVIARTVRRTPEVMVKVLTRGGQDLGAVRQHLIYLNRGGELELETDDGQRLTGKAVEKSLLEDWDLDLEEYRRRSNLDPRARPSSPKLVHKLLFSMPPGTPPQKVLKAVKSFAREEFGFKHRYAMALHTDEPHPHVHMVVKAVSEQGVRLHIQKAMLRGWRQEFARHLRANGVQANATDRAARGQSRSTMADLIYRAALRGDSTHLRKKTIAAAAKSEPVHQAISSGEARLERTRGEVRRGWTSVSQSLLRQDRPILAADVRRFLADMRPPRTDAQWILAETSYVPSVSKDRRDRPRSR